MKHITLLIITTFFLAGCNTSDKEGLSVHRQEQVIEGQVGKDEKIVKLANTIEQEFPKAKPLTTEQKQVVKDNPAGDAAEVIRTLRAEIVDLKKALVKANSRVDFVIRTTGYSASGLLVAAGVATFFLIGQIPWLGKMIGYALIGAGLSIFAMVQAYEFTREHPWIIAVTVFLVGAAFIYIHANWHHVKNPSRGS